MSFRSRTLLALAAGIATTTFAHAADETGDSALRQRIDALDQQIKILARKAEIADEAAAEKAKTAVSAKADAGGFSIGNSDKNNPFSIKFGVLIQADARVWLDDRFNTTPGFPANRQPQQSNTFLLRRAQPTIDAQLGKFLRARVQSSFGSSGTLDLLESWAEFKPVDAFAITGGRFKTIGLEYINSSAGLAFPERGLPTNLVPAYDVGAFLSGKVGEAATWAIGLVNGSPDGATRITDNDDDKDGFVRIGFTPFKAGGDDLLKGLNVVLAATRGYETGANSAGNQSLTGQYRSPGQAAVFGYEATAFATGDRQRLAPAIEWYVGGAGLLAEYTVSSQEITRGAEERNISNAAWQVVGSWLLSDDVKSSSGVNPKQPFDPSAGTWGAFELVGRIGELRIDGAVFEGAAGTRLADPTSQAAKAQSAGIGVNWWVNRNLKWQLSYDYTRFTGGGAARSPTPRTA